VKRDVEGEIRFRVDDLTRDLLGEVLRERKMARARDRKKFGNALNYSVYYRFDNTHGSFS
jgi:hypothetical protein